VYLNYKPLTQVHSLKYLGIVLDCKLTFKEHINYMTAKCTKLIFALSKSTKLSWGLKHSALKTIYTGGILPLLQYGARVWINAIDKACYKSKLTRVQRLINIKIAKAYRTVSNDSLCILTGLTPIAIKLEELDELYQLTRGSRKEEANTDHDVGIKHWLHPSITTSILTDKHEDTSAIQICTDGSKTEQGVGAGIAIYSSGTHTKSLQHRLNNKCTNHQAEQLAILKSLEYTEGIQTEDKTATIYRQPYNTGLSPKHQHTHIPHRKNKTESDGDGRTRLESLLGQSTRWNPRKRTCRHPRKGGSNVRTHYRKLP
jgi:hypothetical protein